MNKENQNIKILQRFNPDNPNIMAKILAEDFVWHYVNPKLSELEGDYVGMPGLTDFFQKLAGLSTKSFKANPISSIPMGDELVVTHVKDTMSLKGKPMEIDAVVVWRIVQGKIQEVWDIPAVHTPKIKGPDTGP